MEILKFDGGKPSKNRNKLVTVIAGAFLVAAVGSTFAANVTINTSNTLEYGQGLTQAAACDPSLKITPSNKFTNATGAGAFYLETITVQDTTTATAAGIGLGNCNGKTIRLTAYGDTGNALNLSGGTTNYCDIAIGTYTSSLVAATNPDNTKCVATVAQGQNFFSVRFTNTPLLASSIYKITLESF
jgi:hypothetical protein